MTGAYTEFECENCNNIGKVPTGNLLCPYCGAKIYRKPIKSGELREIKRIKERFRRNDTSAQTPPRANGA